MAALGVTAATDIASLALYWYVKGKALSQTTQDKPLLKWIKQNAKTFASGNKVISEPVQGAYMSDTAGFIQGITGDDAITYNSASNMLRATYTWYEFIASLWITWTDLLIDGISIVDDTKGGKQAEHSEADMTRLTSILENRLDDFGESYARGVNLMLWQDGTQDAKQIPGLTSIITDTPAVGTTGGLARATYSWWRHRTSLALAASPQNGTLIQFLNSDLIQLKRYGGRPNKALCGSAFLDALRSEVFAKGYLTMTGFSNEKATDLGIGGLHISGMGRFEYDPTMDSASLGMSKACVVLDSRRYFLMKMAQEWDKVLTPERPYNYLVFLHNVKCTGATVATQLNCHAKYSLA